MRFGELQIKTLYNASLVLVAIIAIASFVIIITNGNLICDLSYEGFNRFLEIFKFPLTTVGTFLILLAGKIALLTVEKTAQTNLIAVRHALSEDFIKFVSSECKIPTYELSDGAKFDDIIYLPVFSLASPLISFNRIYVLINGTLSIDDDIKQRIIKVVTLYGQIRENLNGKNYRWVLHLYELCTLAKKFRYHLMIMSGVDKQWKLTPVLGMSSEFGKFYLPNLKEDNLDGINLSIRNDLLGVISVLYFEPSIKPEIKKLFKIVVNIADMRTQLATNDKPLLERSTNYVWQNAYSIVVKNIELSEI
ncbi:hypothetical protein ACJJJB_11600 [Microbulbifer sp. ANSA001]|uniref:hypothetical protein n=1 Tax=Microbulbifer sp. ANSA001 TaxID=3243358 RepID=UPI004040EF62